MSSLAGDRKHRVVLPRNNQVQVTLIFPEGFNVERSLMKLVDIPKEYIEHG